MSSVNEAQTRRDLIDPTLQRAGWDVADPHQVGLEIPVDLTDPAVWSRLRARLRQLGEDPAPYSIPLPPGICDYALYRPNGHIIAVVEAKKTSYDPRYAQTQTEFYQTEIAHRQGWPPFAFMTNGGKIYFLEPGGNKREVHGFFTPTDLENRLYLRLNARPLAAQPINAAITDRPYQHEAVRRVAEAFTQGRRKALLVMATGAGKTRVAMSIVDLFLRADQARRILFVADRDPLVKQALADGFQRHLPHEPATRVYSGRFDGHQRLYVVTLQTLSKCFRSISPGFFDLVIFDEVHRSIFNLWQDPLEYFDARMIGLTATPANLIDRNTFSAFDCHDDVPTFLYSYPDAIRDKYLVDFSLYRAQTQFQRQGIRGVDLSPADRQALIDQGKDPDALDYAGTDLETRVSNKDTLRRQWAEIMDVCYRDRAGQLPGKTIVFAMTQAHAQRLQDAFEGMYPQHPGLVRVITEATNHKGTLIDQFKKDDFPRIAITVDLLETGVDVPEVVNLVFMKPVQSGIKLWQMIGRGTRPHAACLYPDRLPDGHKDGFLIIDFWQNDFNKDATTGIAQGLPVLVTLFNTRLKLLEQGLAQQTGPDFDRLVRDLRAAIARIPRDAYTVQRAWPVVADAWDDDFWRYLTRDKVEFLRQRVAPLLRQVAGVAEDEAVFTGKVERLKLHTLAGRDTVADRVSILEDVSRLPSTVLTADQRAVRDACLDSRLERPTVAELNKVIDTLAAQMKNRTARHDTFEFLDLKDAIASRGTILLYGGSQPIYVERYRDLVERRILDLIDTHPTLQAVSRGQPVTDAQLLDLERTLHHALEAPGVELTPGNIRLAYGLRVGSLLEFVRETLGLADLPDYAAIVRRQFEVYIQSHPFTADQIRFLRAVQNAFLDRRRLALPDLYDPPFTAFGADAVDRYFTPDQVQAILSFTESLAA